MSSGKTITRSPIEHRLRGYHSPFGRGPSVQRAGGTPAIRSPRLIQGSPSKRLQAVKFGDRDVVHPYARVGANDNKSPAHECRGSNMPLSNVTPPFGPDGLFAPTSKLPTTTGLTLNFSSPQELHPADPLPKGHKKIGSGTQHLRSSSAKNYPKGDEEDDEEEGESLWRRGVNQSDEESEMALEESLKGIRLVTQSKE